MYSPTQPIFLFSIINVIELRFIDKPGSILTFSQIDFLILAFFRCSLFFPSLSFSRFLFLSFSFFLSLFLPLFCPNPINPFFSFSLSLSLSLFLFTSVSLCPPISLCLSVCLEQFIFYSHQIFFFALSIYSQQYNNIYTYKNLTSFVYFFDIFLDIFHLFQ